MKDPNDDRSLDLLAGECVSASGHTWEAPLVSDRETPYRHCVWCRVRLPLQGSAEAVDALLSSVEPTPIFEQRVRQFIAAGQAAQRAIDDAARAFDAAGIPARPVQARRGVSKNAAKSADKPERGER